MDSERIAKGSATLKADDLWPDSPLPGPCDSFTIKPGDRLVRDLKLAKGVVVSGRAIDITTSRPIAGMRFDRYLPIDGSNYLDAQSITCDVQGRYHFAVPPGSRDSVQWQRSESGDFIIDQQWPQ
ncbi:MAG: hypothetical protein M1457_12975 [bacterium]|nr:hypothetical protein [bacterium]